MSIQVLRRALYEWEIVRVNTLWATKDGDALEYEIIGRVLKIGAFYYVELPVWNEKGYEWERLPRAYSLARGAYRRITNPPREFEKLRS